MTAPAMLQDIENRHPEWAAWLHVVAQVLPGSVPAAREDRWFFRKEVRKAAGESSADNFWDALVPEPGAETAAGVPMLAAARLPAAAQVSPLLEALVGSASGGGGPEVAGLAAVARTEARARRVFEAAVNGDDAALTAMAAEAGADAALFGAIASLLPMPFLRACGRRWAAARPPVWQHGYCPCCAAWPALAETCGIERSRYLRCGRCGSAWQMPLLICAHCTNDDHDLLATLRLEEESASSEIEVCNHCHGYLKTFTRLRPGAPEQVLLDDLASVELDIAATARDYRRPPGLGYPLGFHAGS